MSTMKSLKVPVEYVVCRICVEEKSSIKKISEVDIKYDNLHLGIQDVLRSISGLEISTIYYICPECIENAVISYKFKSLCENSSSKFEKYLNSVENKLVDEFITVVKEVESPKIENNILDGEECSDDNMPLIYLTHDELHSDSEKNKIFEDKLKKSTGKERVTNRKEVKIRKKRKKKHSSASEKSVDEILGVGNEINLCKFCNKLFKNKYVLLAHEKRHENKGKFVCNECSKGFDSKGCLNRHIRVHTGEKKFQCEECQRCFPSANNLRLHERRHNGIKPYLCVQCGKSFSHPTGLSYHLRTHTRERPYTCEICGKSFLIQCHLDRHKKIHTGERPFACTQCERAFIKKIDLQRHEAIHSGERPHTCRLCNKSFLRILHLNYHMMVHTSERPHRCSYCGKGFIRRYYLTDHIKKRHAVDVKEPGDIQAI